MPYSSGIYLLENEDVVMRTWEMEVGGHRKIGRPTLGWSDAIRNDIKEIQVKIEKYKTGERGDWKLKAPTPNREKAEEEEEDPCWKMP